jgi:hypothetical protein
MRKIFFIIFLAASCNSKNGTAVQPINESKDINDTIQYPYKALYSSNITSPSHPEIAKKVLTVWKMFESNQIEAMRPYWADSIIYHDAGGLDFHGSTDDLLNLAKKDIAGLDSLRFDIVVWQSEHVNDKNEDWVRIWAKERRYFPKTKPDTTLIQENWQVKDGKIVYFDQYKSNLHTQMK